MNETGSQRLLLSDLLSPATVELNLKGGQRDPILEELVNRIPELEGNDEARQRLLRALHEREQLHSTGIGDGIALPHSRNALIGIVEKPVMVFGRHPRGVPYGAIDGEPARLFFLLVAPTVTTHLQILARLTRILRDPRVRRDLLAVSRPEKVIDLIREAELQP